MFGMKRRREADVLLTEELKNLIAVSSVELTAKNDRARATWGLGNGNSWSADLAKGEIRFHFDNHSIVGPVEVLGTFSSESETWLWGWANESVPKSVTGASRATRDFGEAQGIGALTERNLTLSNGWLADDLGSIVVEVASLAGQYRVPTANGYLFLGFTDFRTE